MTETNPASTSAAPIPDVTPAASVTPTKPPALPSTKFTVVQRMLSDSGETELLLPVGSEPLDVHLIDGRYYLRVLEPVKFAEEFEMVVQPVAVGQVIELSERAFAVLPVRHGGIHFLAYRA